MSEHEHPHDLAPAAEADSARAPTVQDPSEIFEADEASRSRIDAAIREIAFSQLLPVTAGLAVISLLLVAAHFLTLQPDVARIMGPVAGITAIAIFQVRRMLLAGRFRAGQAHAVGGAVGLLIAANGLLQLGLTDNAAHTANLIVLVLGAGAVLLDRRWFGIVSIASITGWVFIRNFFSYHLPAGTTVGGGVATPVSSTESWNAYGLGLLGAAVLGYAALTLRRTTFRRIEAFHLQDQTRQEALEDALERTEAARRGEAEARRDLEAAVQDLKDSEDRFRRLADSTFEGILIHSGGIVRDCNARAPELFDCAADRLIGLPLLDLFRCDDEAPGYDPAALARGVLPSECVAVRDDGSVFPVETGTTEAVIAGESMVVTVIRDVTHQHEAERVLREAAEAAEESNRAKSTFLANMSHELRTPLNAVIGFSNILRKNKDGSFGDRDLEYLDRIVSNGKHLLALINDVLDLSKIEAGRMDVVIETVDLRALVEDLHRSFELQARRKGIDLVMELPADVKPIRGDGHRLKQILFNLVGNAMKFTDEGAVTIRVAEAEGGHDARLLEVQDSGIGIPDHRIKEIFAPFQQVDASTSRKYGGTGLGLAISRSLCEMMGFELSASSVEGEGSTFTIDLAPDNPVESRYQPGSVTITEETPQA